MNGEFGWTPAPGGFAEGWLWNRRGSSLRESYRVRCNLQPGAQQLFNRINDFVQYRRGARFDATHSNIAESRVLAVVPCTGSFRGRSEQGNRAGRQSGLRTRIS
jgi:hypothetical protein